MAIILKKTQRVNPRDKNAAKKWYPVQQTLKQMDENEVAELVAEETTLNPAEALMAIRQLRKVVQRALLNGQSVKLGDWGSFNARISGSGADTAKALTADNVKSVNINFLPGKELKAAMQTASFVWVNDLMGTSSSSSSSGSGTDDGGTDNGGSGATGGNPL